MARLERAVIREPGVETADQYAGRVVRLAASYVALFFGSIVGSVLLVWKGKLFVDLTQRSNVETLTLAFFLAFFVYVAALSARGAFGAVQVFYFWLLAHSGHDPDETERRKMSALGPPTSEPPVALLNVVLEREGCRGQPFALRVADTAGEMGTIKIDGVVLTHEPTVRHGSNSLLAYAVHQVADVLAHRGREADLEIVEWRQIDDESASKYLNLTRFARSL